MFEVERHKLKPLQALLAEHQVAGVVIGQTTGTGRIKMNQVIDISLEQAEQAWEEGLRSKLM